MHPQAHEWVQRHAPPDPVSVVDVGGRNINGTIRGLFSPDATYVSVDLYDGEGVTIVGDFRDYQPAEPVDVVVCCEVAEHTAEWRDLVAHAAAVLKPGGLFLLTAAGPGRAPHSAIDGGGLQHGEHYANIDPGELGRVLDLHFASFEIDVAGEDVRARGLR